jgi:hypothetical protein
MRWTGVVAASAVFALLFPALAFAQGAPIGAWCGGSYGAEGTNFTPCVGVQSGAQTAGEASSIQPQIVPTEPQLPGRSGHVRERPGHLPQAAAKPQLQDRHRWSKRPSSSA